MKRIALPLLLASTMLVQVASAQSSTTPVIGYYKFDAPAGKSMWNCAFQTKKDFQGLATTVAGGATTLISQSGAAWTVNQFQTSATPATNSSHFIEILSGPDTGKTADIISNAAASITVEGNLGSTAFTYAVRKHTTLGSIFLTAGLAPFEDEVLLFDDLGVARRYQFDDTLGAEQMVDAETGSINNSDVVVYPGQGFVLTIGGAKTLTFGGGEVSYVRNAPIKIPLYPGVTNIVGLYDPVVASAPLSAAAAGEKHTIGSVGLTTAELAPFEDEIQLFGLSGGSFTRLSVSYFDDTPPGAISDGSNDVGATLEIPNGTAFLVKPTNNNIIRNYSQPAFHP